MFNKKTAWLALAAVLLVAALAACSAAPAPSPSATTTPSTTLAPTTAPAQGNAVSIENFAFDPATLTVKAGTTVVWTNNDSATHNLKSAAFNSPDIAKGQSYEFKFDTKGTYDYTCGIHPSMAGKIVVE
jgi:plastocyanin